MYLNQASFGSSAATVSAAADSFSQTVTDFEGGAIDLNTVTFSGLNINVAPGDLIQVKLVKSNGAECPAIVTLLFS